MVHLYYYIATKFEFQIYFVKNHMKKQFLGASEDKILVHMHIEFFSYDFF